MNSALLCCVLKQLWENAYITHEPHPHSSLHTITGPSACLSSTQCALICRGGKQQRHSGPSARDKWIHDFRPGTQIGSSTFVWTKQGHQQRLEEDCEVRTATPSESSFSGGESDLTWRSSRTASASLHKGVGSKRPPGDCRGGFGQRQRRRQTLRCLCSLWIKVQTCLEWQEKMCGLMQLVQANSYAGTSQFSIYRPGNKFTKSF